MSDCFFDSGLLTFCGQVKSELSEISIFNDKTEEFWKRNDAELQSELNEQLKDIPEQYHDEYISSYGLDLHFNQILFPNIHRSSTIISVHSYLEDMMNQLTGLIAFHVKPKTSYKTFKRKFIGSNFSCTKEYIAKVSDLDLSGVADQCQELENINQLRNQLVHEGGHLPLSGEHDLNRYVTESKLLSGAPESKVKIESGFIGFYIDVLVKFFDGLDNEVAEFTLR